jgi:hypothetical protein
VTARRSIFEIGGQAIQANQHVVCVLGAANRDPAQFAEPIGSTLLVHELSSPKRRRAHGRAARRMRSA